MATNHPITLAAICAATAMVGCGGGSEAPATGSPVRTAQGCVAGTERLDIASGDGQTGAPGEVLAQRPTVRLSCENFDTRGNTLMLSGADIDWYDHSGPANLVDGEAKVTRQSTADGTSMIVWTLGQAHGTTLRIEARHQSLTATFSATTPSTTTTALHCNDPGGTYHGAVLNLSSASAWSAAGSPHRGGTVNLNSGSLSIEAGAVICVENIAAGAGNLGWVSAVGTAKTPVRFIGTALRAGGELAHVIGDNMPAVGATDHPLFALTDSSFGWSRARDPAMCAQVVLGGYEGGSAATLRRVSIEKYGSADCAALALFHPESVWDYGPVPIEVRVQSSIGDGVAVTQSRNPAELAGFTNCEVSASGRHGIVVADLATGKAPKVEVSGCNLFGNDGNAIENLSIASVQAVGNWWGDPAGPQGPKGDGTSGAVDASGALTGARVLGY